MASGEGGRERIADFDVSPPPRYVSTEEDEGAETSENHVVQEALATAKNLFASIAASVAGEFKIPALEYQLLGKMNKVASEKYGHMADFTSGLAIFVESLREKEESLVPLATQIDGLEGQLDELEAIVQQLDEYSKRLENRVKKYVFS